MKKFITLCLIVICNLGLVSCDAMTRQDVGMVTGGVAGGILGSQIGGGTGKFVAIAAGTLAGSMIGGSVGRSMDAEDRARMHRAFENNNVGQPAYWRNAHTGTTYEVIPTRNLTIGHNRYCREYRTVAIINGQKQQIYGKACRQADGSWRIVN